MPVLLSNVANGVVATVANTTYIIDSDVVIGNSAIAFNTNNFDNVSLLSDGIIASDTDSAIQVLNLSDSTSILLSENSIVMGVIGVEVLGTNTAVVNDGRILGESAGVYLATTATLENTGSISGSLATGDAVYLVGASSIVFNTGTLAGRTGVRIEATGTDTSVTTSGTITADNYGIDAQAANVIVTNSGTISAGNQGVFFGDSFGTLINSGTISGVRYGVNIAGETAGGESSIVNSGIIESADTAVSVNADLLVLDNSGTISAVVVGVAASNNAELQVTNTGTISSGELAIRSSSMSDTVDNSGTIQGIIELSAGSDVVNNSGDIVGDIDTGADADVITNSGTIVGQVEMQSSDDQLFNSGEIIGDVFLEDGDDFLLSGNGSITGTVLGQAGADFLILGQGLDEAFGGTESDLIYGNGGEDRLYGDENGDGILGGAGDDVIYGGTGNDLLFGGDGIDVIYGGAGADLMYGDTGSDFFTFEDVSESAPGSRDIIVDFEVGLDFIDLFAVSDSLVFIGANSFSATGQAEVRVTTPGGVSSTVRVDVDGNGSTDMEILLLNATGLTAAEFGI
jgi:serralysin